MDLIDDRVVHIFNEMRNDYDDLKDLWYAWLFSRLHYFIAQDIVSSWKVPVQERVLDVGCGTGFQSFLYASVGAEVVGIDIAGDLVQKATRKIEKHEQEKHLDLFSEYHDFVGRYNRLTRNLLDGKFGSHFIRPQFQVASAVALPWEDEAFSHINCCGSVLSLEKNWGQALDEIARVLKPGGTFFFEVESKWNGDAFWPLVDWVLGGKLGYESTLQEALSHFTSNPSTCMTLEYPFGEPTDPIYMDITLFTKYALRRELANRRLSPKKWRTIHSVTNLIPSTILDSSVPSPRLKTAFKLLSCLEEVIPLALPGCSLVVSGLKTKASKS
jgi:ubiquinone/menaquinone biosynthesis C-methylase UbiE